jgi:tetratricopeptide (TPR) repeat protein
MKKLMAWMLPYMIFAVTAAWGQNSMDYYKRGLESSLARKKIEYFTKAIQLDPNLVEAYEKRAIHYYFQRRFHNAIQDYTRVIELEPYRPNAYFMRGLTYLKMGHPEGLMAEVSRFTSHLLERKPSEPSALLDTALDDFSRAIELDPHLAAAYSYRAQVYRLKGMVDEAIADATMAIQLRQDPRTTARAYAIRAETYRQLGRLDLYEPDFHKAIELDPYSPDYPPLHVPLMLGYSTNMASLKAVRWAGVLFIIVLTVVVVFHLSLRAPSKKE